MTSADDLYDIAQALAQAISMLAERDRIIELRDSEITELRGYQEAMNKANETLRQLVDIVDPSIWHDGQANMLELIDKVRDLKYQSDDVAAKATELLELRADADARKITDGS